MQEGRLFFVLIYDSNSIFLTFLFVLYIHKSTRLWFCSWVVEFPEKYSFSPLPHAPVFLGLYEYNRLFKSFFTLSSEGFFWKWNLIVTYSCFCLPNEVQIFSLFTVWLLSRYISCCTQLQWAQTENSSFITPRWKMDASPHSSGQFDFIRIRCLLQGIFSEPSHPTEFSPYHSYHSQKSSLVLDLCSPLMQEVKGWDHILFIQWCIQVPYAT